MKKGKNKIIGYITPFIWGDISLGYFKGALLKAREEDKNMVCYIGQRLGDQKDYNYQANAIYQHMNDQWVDALVVWASQIGETLSKEQAHLMAHHFPQIPIVALAGVFGQNPYILTDDQKSVGLLMEHLVNEHKYSRIGFVRGPLGHALADGRYKAYLDALKKYDLALDKALITAYGPFEYRTGTMAMDYYESLWPGEVHKHLEAVICASDAFAKTLIERARDLGYLIPEHFAVVGINNKAESRMTNPPLTTIDPRIQEIGYKGMTYLSDMFDEKQVEQLSYVEPILVIRRSCGCSEDHLQKHYIAGDLSFKVFFSEEGPSRQDRDNMIALIHDLLKGSIFEHNEEIIAGLYDYILLSIRRNDIESFLHYWNEVLIYAKQTDENLDIWDRLLTQLGVRIVEHIETIEDFKKYQNMINRARVALASSIDYQLSGYHNKVDQMLKAINQTNASLRTAIELRQVMKYFAELLPHLAIPSCYVVTYDDQNNQSLGRVIFAYKEGQTTFDENAPLFETKELLQEGCCEFDEPYCLFTQSIYYKDVNFGYVVFEAGPIDKSIYQILTTELSGAIYRSYIFTALKEVEEEREELLTTLEEKNLNLEKEVDERTKDIQLVNQQLQVAVEEAKEANRAKSQFLANISHEIRTPLNCIIGFSDIIASISKDPTVSRYINLTIEETEKLMLLINQLLDLSKIEAGKFELYYEPMAIDGLMESLVSTYMVVANNKDLTFEYTVEPNIPNVVKGDHLRLRQVLVNLIGNAIKFTESGGISVIVRIDQPKELMFEIHDSGIGIEEDRLESIFNVFEQENSKTSKFYGGTGLGTSISKQLVELMGGRIWVESEKNVGSTFKFTVPFDYLTDGEIKAYRESKGRKYNEERIEMTYPASKILIVEDYPPNRMLALAYLSPLKARVSVAINGAEALEMIRRQHYDLVLMDVQMPIVDGIEATKTIRAELYGPEEMIIIGMTANAFESDLATYRHIGMNDVVTKPFRKSSLLNVVTKWLSGSKYTTSEVYVSMDEQTRIPYNHRQLLRELGGEEDLLDELLSEFVTHTALNIEKLTQAVHDQNLEEIRIIAHTIKGGALNLTANVIGDASAAIEMDARNKYGEDMPRLLEVLREQFEAFNRYLEVPIDQRKG